MDDSTHISDGADAADHQLQPRGDSLARLRQGFFVEDGDAQRTTAAAAAAGAPAARATEGPGDPNAAIISLEPRDFVTSVTTNVGSADSHTALFTSAGYTPNDFIATPPRRVVHGTSINSDGFTNHSDDGGGSGGLSAAAQYFALAHTPQNATTAGATAPSGPSPDPVGVGSRDSHSRSSSGSHSHRSEGSGSSSTGGNVGRSGFSRPPLAREEREAAADTAAMNDDGVSGRATHRVSAPAAATEPSEGVKGQTNRKKAKKTFRLFGHGKKKRSSAASGEADGVNNNDSGEDDNDDDEVSEEEKFDRPITILTPAEEQAARMRAYGNVSGTTMVDFLKETRDALVPDAVNKIVEDSVDVVTRSSGKVLPPQVSKAAQVASNTIQAGAGHIETVIEAVPDLMVKAIPNALMSKETKVLLFGDFSNTFRSFFHTNILSMPFVLNQAGLVGGILLLLFVAVTSEYSTEAYFGAKNQMKAADTVVVYGDVPMMIWGDWYPMLNIFYGITHLIGFIAFTASNSRVLLAALGVTGGGATALSLIAPSVIALPMVFMKQATHQLALAILSNSLVFASMMMMFVYFPYSATDNIKLWPSSANDFFVALGVSVYAFTGIGSAIPVERTMRASRYVLLLRISVGVAFAILLAFGLSGFLSYGRLTCSVMTVSLQPGQMKTAVSAVLFAASVFIIPQQTFPLCELCDRRLLGIRRLTHYYEWQPNLLRIGCLVLSAAFAYLVPYYGLIMSIAGAVGCGILGLVVPAALDYVRRVRRGLRHNRSLRWWEYVVVFGIGAYGCAVVVIGVIFGLYNMWMTIQTNAQGTC